VLQNEVSVMSQSPDKGWRPLWPGWLCSGEGAVVSHDARK
jgi:hypothetical protein